MLKSFIFTGSLYAIIYGGLLAEPLVPYNKRVVDIAVPKRSSLFEVIERIKTSKINVNFKYFNVSRSWGTGYREMPLEKTLKKMADQINIRFLFKGTPKSSLFLDWAEKHPNVEVRYVRTNRSHGFVDNPNQPYVIFDGDVFALGGQPTFLSIDQWQDYHEDFDNLWEISPRQRLLDQ